MKILKSFLAFVCSNIAGYLIWLAGYFIMPLLLGLGWGWLVTYVIIISLLVTVVITSMLGWIFSPLIALCSNNKSAMVLSVIALCWWGFCTFKIPLNMELHFTLIQWIWTLVFCCTLIPIFFTVISTLIEEEK